MIDKIVSPFLKILKIDEEEAPQSAQESLPYEELYKDGICYLGKGKYNICIEFLDINYMLTDTEDKVNIFERYEALLNGFNDGMHIQFCYLNQKYDESVLNALISVPNKGDNHDDLREELDKFLKQMQSGSSLGLMKRKFLILGVQSDSKKSAKLRLRQIELQTIAGFKKLGCKAYAMNGKQRANLMFRCMNRHKRFKFSWDKLASENKTTKDAIAPNGFEFGKAGMFKIDRQVCVSSLISITAEQLQDNFLTDILSSDYGMLVSFHLDVLPSKTATKLVKGKLIDTERMILEHAKRAARDGLTQIDPPPDLAMNKAHLQDMLESITRGNQKLFSVTATIVNIADNPEELRIEHEAINDVIERHNCVLKPLNWQQEQGFYTSLPLGFNKIEQNRIIPSKPFAISIPFIIATLFQVSNGSIYYGVDSILGKLIMSDRKALRTPNGLYLGTPGSGKSFAAKMEIFFNFLKNMHDYIMIIDPENEYGRMVEALGGTLVNISPASNSYINPLDISLITDDDSGDEDDRAKDPLVMKTDFLLSFCSLAMERPLSAMESSIIDRCVPPIYKDLIDEFNETGLENPEKVPILSDLCEELLKQNETERELEIVSELVIGLEKYVKGQFKIFNHRTNIDINNRLVCFNTQELGNSIAELGMLIVQEQIWNRVKINRAKNVSTYAYLDEFHLLLREEKSASYSVEIWKRFRKWGGIPTGITQNVKVRPDRVLCKVA